MELIKKKAIETYQCAGCTNGYNIKCFQENEVGIGCSKHSAGTLLSNIGKIFLGLPKGFNRLGFDEALIPHIYRTFNDSLWAYDKYNVPTWKFLNSAGHTIVRGHIPRRNMTFIHIFLEDCMDKIECIEISKEEINEMD